MKTFRISLALALALYGVSAAAQPGCIPSGEIDIHTYFIAVDATDRTTFETGLNTWTIYRTRNGAAETAYTTPTVTEIDATNAPGMYELLIDEDTTIGSGNDYEPYGLRITNAAMVPVSKELCIVRSKITLGETVTATGGAANADTKLVEGADATNTIRDSVVDDATRLDGSALNTLSTHDPGETIMGATDLGTGGGFTSLASAANLATANAALVALQRAFGKITTAASVTNQTTFTLTAGSDDDDAYNGWLAFEVDASTDETALGIVSDYTGSSKTVTLCADPTTGNYDLATSDHVIMIPGKFTDCGTTLAKLDDTLEDNAGTYRFTESALAEGPAGGGGGGTDWSADERTAMRAILGIPGSGTTPADPSTGILDTIRDKTTNLPSDPADDSDLDSQLSAINAKTTNLPSDPADDSDLDSQLSAINAKTTNLPSDPADDSDLDSQLSAINAKTTNLPSDPADASVVAGLIGGLNNISVAQVQGLLDAGVFSLGAVNEDGDVCTFVISESIPHINVDCVEMP